MQHHMGRSLIKSVVFSAAMLFSVISQAQEEFPAGEGRDLLFFACGACHGLDHITAPHKKLTAEEWEIYVYDMVAKGANLDKDEMEIVKQYLVKNFAAKE